MWRRNCFACCCCWVPGCCCRFSFQYSYSCWNRGKWSIFHLYRFLITLTELYRFLVSFWSVAHPVIFHRWVVSIVHFGPMSAPLIRLSISFRLLIKTLMISFQRLLKSFNGFIRTIIKFRHFYSFCFIYELNRLLISTQYRFHFLDYRFHFNNYFV